MNAQEQATDGVENELDEMDESPPFVCFDPKKSISNTEALRIHSAIKEATKELGADAAYNFADKVEHVLGDIVRQEEKETRTMVCIDDLRSTLLYQVMPKKEQRIG